MDFTDKLMVNEIYTSVKGEGLYTGELMHFIRMSGCNLACLGCDTDHSTSIPIDVEQIVWTLLRWNKANCDVRRVVLTGGEPLMQDVEPLVNALIQNGFYLHLETNGYYDWNDAQFIWVAVSPKNGIVNQDVKRRLRMADEVKLVTPSCYAYLSTGLKPLWDAPVSQIIYIQPWAIGQFPDQKAVQQALEMVRKAPWLRYSVQLHKAIGVR